MNQARCSERAVPLAAHLDKLGLKGPVLEVLVLLPMLLHSKKRHWRALSVWWVVMSHPDLGLVGQSQELPSRVVDRFRASSWEVSTGRANVHVENGVSDKDIAWFVLVLFLEFNTRTVLRIGERQEESVLPPIL